MPSPGQELASLDFESLIGGPLVAVVNAQAQSAISTVNFIKQVGFKPSEGDVTPTEQTTGEPATVTFQYVKSVPTDDGGTEDRTASLTVPFLTMLPIPTLRVEEVNIQFLAKINSVRYRQVDTDIQVDSELEAKAGWFFGSSRLKVSSTFQRHTRQGTKVTRDYSMDVKVKATQDEIPGGLDRLLTILESLIEEDVEDGGGG